MKVYCILFALFGLYTVSVVTDVVGPIPYQNTCDPSSNASCSTNSLCACGNATSGEVICTQQMSCDYATPCTASNTCVKDGSVCVIDGRCPGKYLCYLIDLFSPDFCPPPSNQTSA